MSIEAKVEKAVRRTNLLWNQWYASSDAEIRTEIKAQIDAVDAEIRSLLDV